MVAVNVVSGLKNSKLFIRSAVKVDKSVIICSKY